MITFSRAEASLFALAFALSIRSELSWRTGDWAAVYSDLEEAQRLSREVELGTMLGFELTSRARLDACRGRVVEARRWAGQALDFGGREEYPSVELHALAALGLVELVAGDSAAARGAYERAATLAAAMDVREEASAPYSDGLVEACVGTGDLEAAAAVVAQFAERSSGTRCPGTLAALARTNALVAVRDGADRFAEAIDLAEKAGQPFELGRTLLASGERLRRERSSTSAREQLSAALDIFHRLGAEPWERRAQRELSAGGWLQPSRTPASMVAGVLTPQELEVAFAVAGGATNKEVATSLFLSIKTVEFHLKNVYRKLGLRSRSELARKVAEEAWFERT